ncbi:MAG TPA: transposase [Candidatus Saccharimonadales bacterium]
MPSRNVYKTDVEDSYYHVYARGAGRSKIFQDDSDCAKFISLFQRYLSREAKHDSIGVPYPHLYDKLELLCFCLMENHFHLLVYQRDAGTMQRFMRGVMTSYSRYFNKKYDRSGPLFETRYKASLISNPSYLEHISRYIHLNRKQWRDSPYTSIGFYIDGQQAEWLRPARILEMFPSKAAYTRFVADYEANRQMMDELKYELANDITT